MITTTIMNYFAQGVLYILSFVIYAFLAGKILPAIFLHPSYKGLKSYDRGLKHYVYDDGRAIVYKPTEENSKYIEQYILSANGDEKFVKCKINEKIYSLEYDVVAFNSRDKVLDVIAVKDPIREKGMSAAVSLPLETSYVSVIAKKVNRVRVTKKPTVCYSYLKMLCFSLLCSALTVAQVMLIRNLVFPLVDHYIHYTGRVGNSGIGATIIISAIIGFAVSALVVLLHCSDSIKIKNDSLIWALTKKIFTKMRGVRHGSKSTANFKRILSIFSSK